RDPATAQRYPLSLHDALPISGAIPQLGIHRTLTAIGVTIGSLLAADLLYRWVEVPMIDVGRRIVAWRKERADRRTAVALSRDRQDRKSTRLNSSHRTISYAVF